MGTTQIPLASQHGTAEDWTRPILPATRSRRRLGGLACIGAGLLTMAGIVLTPFAGEDGTTAGYLRSLTAAPTRASVAALVLHLGYLLFVPAFFVLAHLARRRAVRLANVGLCFGVLGSALSGLVASDYFDLNAAQYLGIDKAAAMSDRLGHNPMGILFQLPTIVGMTLGLVLLLMAAWRARWISWRPAVLATAGWVIGFGPGSVVKTWSGFALIAIAIVIVGVRVLRMSDRQWENALPQ
jgi:hypothetical protein